MHPRNRMTRHRSDVLIVGGGMVGLCVAHQLMERGITKSITILDKEPELGRHSSGRNSGVLHAGLYYKPGSLKNTGVFLVLGALGPGWRSQGLPLNSCGKLIVPPRLDLDAQLDVLAERGRANGAVVELWDESQLNQVIPEARSASAAELFGVQIQPWSGPIAVLQQLQKELKEQGVRFLLAQDGWTAKPEHQTLQLVDGSAFFTTICLIVLDCKPIGCSSLWGRA